jgi:hypothetical protein
MIDLPPHPIASFWLDVADKAIKLAAVLIGGLWTWWNFSKSRIYEQKLELDIIATAFLKSDLYGDAKFTVKNIGEAKHSVQHTGTFCEIFVIREDLKQESVEVFRVFAHNSSIEPGESINDTAYWRIARPLDGILWVKITLRVISNGVEWFSTRLIWVGSKEQESRNEVNHG